MSKIKILLKKINTWLIRILVFVIIAGVIGGLGYWGWYEYTNRPQVITQLAGISLGDKVVDVRLTLGKPSSEFSEGNDSEKKNNLNFSYNRNYNSLNIFFKSDEKGKLGVERICSSSYLDDVLDLGVYDSERKIIDKLGEPVTISINANGLKKIINYPQWNIAFILEKKEVIGTCISSNEEGISYVNEYSDN